MQSPHVVNHSQPGFLVLNTIRLSVYWVCISALAWANHAPTFSRLATAALYLLLLSPLAITSLGYASTVLRQQLAQHTADTLTAYKLSLLGVIGLELLSVTYLVNALTAR